MESDTQLYFSQHAAPPVFNGQNYQAWAIRMKVYLDALDLWEPVEDNNFVQPLPANPTVAQMKAHEERKTRQSKATTCLYSVVSSSIFTRIMNLSSVKDIWDHLKKEYQGNERTKNMQVLNLIREFDMLKMKESTFIKDFSDKLVGIANKIKLLGKDFVDERIVQKILVTLPKIYESKISSLEESKDLTTISVTELVSALQAEEQRRTMRKEDIAEGAYQVKFLDGNCKACPHCKKTNNPPNKCWWRADAKCNRCGGAGHIDKVCKAANVQVAIQQVEEELF